MLIEPIVQANGSEKTQTWPTLQQICSMSSFKCQKQHDFICSDLCYNEDDAIAVL